MTADSSDPAARDDADDDDLNGQAGPLGAAGRDRALLPSADRQRRPRRLVERALAEPPRPVMAPDAEAASFAWLPYLIFFLRRRWPWLAGGLAAGAGLAVLYALTATPLFTATTQLLVDIRRSDLMSQQHGSQDSQILNSELESRVEILRSEGLAREVVKKLDLVQQFAQARHGGVTGRLGGILQPAPAPQPDSEAAVYQATLALMRMTSVRRIGLTYVIEISVTSPNAMQSAQLANGLVDSYVNGQLASQDQVTRQAGRWMEERLHELRDQASVAGNAVEQYKADKKIIMGDKGLLNEQQLSQLNMSLVAAQQRSSAAKSLADQARAALAGDVTGAQGSDLKSQIITTLRAAYLEDAQRAARWASAYGGNNAQVVKLRSEMQQIEVSIRSELQRIAASYEADAAVAISDQQAIQQRLNGIVEQTVKTNSDRVELSSLQSSANTYRTVYENFLNRYTQAVQDESFPVSEARVITAAKPPLRKSAPHGKMLASLGGFLGLAGGFAAAFAIEMLDGRLRTREQLRAATGLTCIGQLPRLEPAENAEPASPSASRELRLMSKQPGKLRAAIDHPHSDFVQSLRALQARLNRGLNAGDEIRSIGFVPAGAGDGSTTVAANFAQFLANCGHRTLLIDLDIDDDRLSRALAPDATEGLLQALAHPGGLHRLIWRDAQTGIEFLPLGRLTPRGPPRMLQKAAELVFERLAATYDYVIVDLPPLSPAAEGHSYANLLDGFVLVVDWASVPHDVLADRMLNTGLDPALFVGAVYNRVDFRKLRRYVSGASVAPGWA